MKKLFFLVGCLLTPLVFLLRWSFRVEFINDPRPALREANQPFVYSMLHAHILYVLVGYRRSDIGTAVMISRSNLGELLVPILRAHGLVPVRGSGRFLGRDKGGGKALDELVPLLENCQPPLLAVDGPRGPRGHVYAGVAKLMQRTGAVAVYFTPEVRRRKILNTWDRLQLPMPFASGKGHFGEPLRIEPGETCEQFSQRLQATLMLAEQARDPAEAAAGLLAADRQRQRLAAKQAGWEAARSTHKADR